MTETGRTAVAAHLSSVLPDTWRVVDHDTDVTLSGPHPCVMTYVERIEVGVTRAYRKYTVTVLVMVAKQTDESDDLEDALEEVLEVLDLWDYPADWTLAERQVFAETYPCYRVTTEVNVRREYPSPNVDPVAAFTYGSDHLQIGVDGSNSTDPDGEIEGYAWDFGDGSTGSGVATGHLYAVAGTYPVTLTVTDNRGGTDSTTIDITVTD